MPGRLLRSGDMRVFQMNPAWEYELKVGSLLTHCGEHGEFIVTDKFVFGAVSEPNS